MEISRLDFRRCGITLTSTPSSHSSTSSSSSPCSSSSAADASWKDLVHTDLTSIIPAFNVFLFLLWLESVFPFPLFSTERRRPSAARQPSPTSLQSWLAPSSSRERWKMPKAPPQLPRTASRPDLTRRTRQRYSINNSWASNLRKNKDGRKQDNLQWA